ncbi:hypothetical protein [Porphyrobacter sp. AAP82]|uniref:hypothetical protein n=1 Tax=Porphyrobacter sp. AAP82 TaxID=1248917 RepID=UPI0012DC77C7|nr:hypothetical protein [Porphyrobacter sp. AAP82]
MRGSVAAVAAALLCQAVPLAGAAVRPLCGTGRNAGVCFASVDRNGRLSAAERAKLAAAAPVAVDIVSSRAFAAELAAFHAALPARWVKANRYWRGFDPVEATAAIQTAFAGLHIDTRGGAQAQRDARFGGNLAYEGSTDARTGERFILLNRYRLDRPAAGLVGTYVHEAAHKAGYSHRAGQSPDQKCEPPYVMAQLARKLADPESWPGYAAGKNACRFWRTMK